MSRTLIKNGIIITVNASDEVISKGWVLIEDDKIMDIGVGQPPKLMNIEKTIDATGKAVLPGIVDIHTHVCGSLFKGMTEDPGDGLYRFAMPMERLLTPESTYELSMLGCAECLTGGVTCINDIYHFMRATARAVDDIGMRGVLAHKIIEVDLTKIQYGDYTRIPVEGRARVEENILLIEEYHKKKDGRILCKFGPHATDTVSMELAKDIKVLGDKYGVGFHIHVAQKKQEFTFLKSEYGLTPVEYLRETGLLGETTVAAHCQYINENDMKLLADSKTNFAFCAEITAKCGAVTQLTKTLHSGVRISFGTDWVTMDPWTNMRIAIMMMRLDGCTNEEINARVALRKSTIEPAIHLGLGDQIGSIERGKQADIIMIDLGAPNLTPIFYDPTSTIVYNANRSDVDTVMIAGNILVEEKKLKNMDMKEIMRNAQKVASSIYEMHREGK